MNKLVAITLLFVLFVCSAYIMSNKKELGKWERPVVRYPKDNPKSLASEDLGNILFSENLLSRDTSISCRTCHLLETAFADNLVVGEGIKGRTVTRNSPTLFNIGYHPYFMIDGKFNSLEDQVLGPINDHREFDMSPELVVERLRAVPQYNELSIEAYGEEFSIEIVKKAIANFERLLVADQSKFDKYKRGEGQLNDLEMKGWELFQSPKLNCISCHSGYNFTNYEFLNNGIYKVYQDSGRALITNNLEDLAKFKVPTLRNIALTYPYMHDGSFKSLDSVIEHYAAGGKGHLSQSKLIKGFSISEHERNALLAFLHSLTEERLISD